MVSRIITGILCFWRILMFIYFNVQLYGCPCIYLAIYFYLFDNILTIDIISLFSNIRRYRKREYY